MRLWLGMLAAALMATPAAAQVDERAAVAEVVRLVRESYVVPEKRAATVARLQASLASGRYAVEEPQAFAARVTEDLQATTGDGHMMLMHDPKQAAALGGRTGDETRTGEYWETLARKQNHGVVELKILPGGVRYMNLVGFLWTGEASRQALTDAMRFLAGGEAAIIDLRQNGGGSPEAVRYVASHFVPAGTHLIDFQMPEGNTRSTAEAELPAGRLIGKPLYVLTSRHAASAAEEFASHVALFKLGELVGEPTAGAAHRNDLFPVPGGFVASISVGRPIHPVSKGNWEGTGVPPTIAAPADQALDVAHMRAAEKLAAAPGPEQAAYRSLAEMLRARVSPAKLAAAPDAYVGRFGERAITLEDGKLMYQRQGGPKRPLQALTPDTFVIDGDPSTRVTVRLEGGRAAAIQLRRGDGTISDHPRS